MTTPTSPETLDALQTQWPEAMSELDSDDVDLVWLLLDAVKSTTDVSIEVRDIVAGEWQVGVCLADRVGTLSLVSGLLTAHGLDIVHADTFTVAHSIGVPTLVSSTPRRVRQRADARALPRRRRQTSYRQTLVQWAVMLLNVRARSERPPDWEAFASEAGKAGRQAATGKFDAARLDVIERFSHTMQVPGPCPVQGYWGWVAGKLPVDISTDNTSSDDHSLLEITSVDTPGFLFAFSIALSSVRVNVVRSRIRTDGDMVRDTFWLTEPSGEKIESDLSA